MLSLRGWLLISSGSCRNAFSLQSLEHRSRMVLRSSKELRCTKAFIQSWVNLRLLEAAAGSASSLDREGIGSVNELDEVERSG